MFLNNNNYYYYFIFIFIFLCDEVITVGHRTDTETNTMVYAMTEDMASDF